jgi:NAD(P)-dependent dehydrogenase (short-subunit alcohol dehydrogenase family)
MGLDGRVALVTGGGRGIGRAIALTLARDGADVAVNYRRDEDAAKETVKAVEALGRRGIAYRASVDDAGDDEAMAEAVLGDFGFVDILVHNAGIASRGLSVVDTDPAEIERVWRTHAFGAFLLSKLLVPSMRTRPRGDVVMISSCATVGWGPNSSPYNIAKASLEALAWTLAKGSGATAST